MDTIFTPYETQQYAIINATHAKKHKLNLIEAAVFRFLQNMLAHEKKPGHINTHFKGGHWWIPRFPASQIHQCFPIVKHRENITVILERLESHKNPETKEPEMLVFRQTTGLFVEHDLKTHRRIDCSSWITVPEELRNTADGDIILVIPFADIEALGISAAAILAYLKTRLSLNRISITQIEGHLPLERGTISKCIDELIKAGRLERLPNKSKGYKIIGASSRSTGDKPKIPVWSGAVLPIRKQNPPLPESDADGGESPTDGNGQVKVP